MTIDPAEAVDKFDYDPPEVIWRPIKNSDGDVNGYQIDPPFDFDWDHLTTLRHFAALIEHRTGLKLRVAPSETPLIVEVEDDDSPPTPTYEVLTGHATGGPAPYEVLWSWLSGFENGHNELLWVASKKAEA